MKGPVLIVGATGLVGGGVRRALESAGIPWEGTSKRAGNAPGYHFCDIEDEPNVRALVASVRPEVVVHTAALTHVDFCESHPDATRAQNVDGTRNVARAAAAVGARFVFFSTDYLFDGQTGPYREQDPVNPLSVYARSKRDGELEAAQCPGALIVRTTVVYGWDRASKNFLMQMHERQERGETMRVPTDQWSTPTDAQDLGECVLELLRRGARGVFHVTGSDLLTRYDFAVRAAEVLGWNAALVSPVATADLGSAAPRPLRAGLVIDKFRQFTGRTPIGVDEGLKRFKTKRDSWLLNQDEI